MFEKLDEKSKENIKGWFKDLGDLANGLLFSDEAVQKASDQLKRLKDITGRNVNRTDENGNPIYDKNTRTTVGVMNAVSQGESKIATEGLNVLKKSFGILEDLHKRLLSASPLLRNIESLFNLAVQLFFMPLGNKLAEIMIPAVIDLVDRVTALWESFEGKSLGQILGIMIEEGATIFGEYFNDLGDQLEDEGGLLGSIASFLHTIGDMIQSGELVTFIKVGLGLLTFIIDHFKEMIALIVAFKAASLANQIATMFVIATSVAYGGTGAPAGLAIAAAASAASLGIGAAAGSAAYSYMDSGGSLGAAALGATPAGVIYNTGKVTTQEATKGAKQIKSLTEHNSVTYQFYGYTDDDVRDTVKREVSDQIKYAKLKGSF